MGSILSPNRVIAKDVKSCTYCCYIRCVTLIVCVGGNALAPNRRNSLPCTVRTSRQRSCNQRVGCLQQLGSRALGPAKRSGPRLFQRYDSYVCNCLKYLNNNFSILRHSQGCAPCYKDRFISAAQGKVSIIVTLHKNNLLVSKPNNMT